MSVLKATALYVIPAIGIGVSSYICGADRQNIIAPLGVALFSSWSLFGALLKTELLG